MGISLPDLRQTMPALDGLDDDSAVNLLHTVYYPDMDREKVASALGVKPTVPVDNSSDFMRGAKVALGQTLPIAKGVIGLVGATAENEFGAGGISTGIKNWGLRGYQEGMAKLAPLQKDTDELTTAWDRAKDGDIGALVDWAQYGLGYAVGQGGEAVATSVLGGAIGAALAPEVAPVSAAGGAITGLVAKGAVKNAAVSLIEKAVSREANALMASAVKAGTEMTAEQAVKQATKGIAGNIASTGALLAYGTGQELGSIYPDAEAQAAQEGRQLTGSDLARVWASGIAAGGIEGLTDKLGVEAALGKVRIPGAHTRLGSAALTGAAGAGVEGLTEGVQTAIEHYGAGQPIADAAGLKDIINSAGLGMIGGAGIGVGAGALHGPAAMHAKADEAFRRIGSATTVDEAIAAFNDTHLPLVVPTGFDAEGAMARMERQMQEDQTGLRDFSGRLPEVPSTVSTNKPAAAAGLLSTAGGGYSGEASATAVPQEPFNDRLITLREQLAQTRVRQQVRDELGPQALNDIMYYAQRADDEHLPGKTSDRMLSVAEAMLSRALAQPIPDRSLTVNQPAAQQLLTAAPGVPLLPLDTTPTGTIRVDQAGNAAPETRADVVSLADRARAAAAGRGQGMTASVPRGTEPGAGVMVGQGTGTSAAFPPAAAQKQLPGPTAMAQALQTAGLGSAPIDVAAHETAATSPHNDIAEPTQAMKEAGNYPLSHLSIAGMDISIENPEGSTRRGTDESGKPWETTMAQAHYGYFKGSIGLDKDHVDVFVKSGTPSDYNGPVFVVDQIDPKTGKPDEHKVVLGAATEADARSIYSANYSSDWKGLGAITKMEMPAFKAWVTDHEATKKPLALSARAAAVKAAAPAQTPAERLNLTGGSQITGTNAAGQTLSGQFVGYTSDGRVKLRQGGGNVHYVSPESVQRAGEPHAAQTVSQQTSVQPERSAGNEGGKTPETSPRGGVLSAGESAAAPAAQPVGTGGATGQREAQAGTQAKAGDQEGKGAAVPAATLKERAERVRKPSKAALEKEAAAKREAASVAMAERQRAIDEADARLAAAKQAGADMTKRAQEQFNRLSDLKAEAKRKGVPFDREAAIKQIEAEAAGQPTHADPGKAPEPVTTPVVAESLKKAARAEDRKPSEMKADLLAQIDKAIAAAPERPNDIGTTEARTTRGKLEFSGAREGMRIEVRQGTDDLWHAADMSLPHSERYRKPLEIFHADGPMQARRHIEALLARSTVDKKGHIVVGEASTVTFDVPGDGVFKVLNDADRLAEFRAKVDASAGFKDNARSGPPIQSAPASAGTVAAVSNMIEEGDFQAATDYAAAKGINLDDLKLSKTDRSKLDKWSRDNPNAVQTQSNQIEETPEPAAAAAPAPAPAPSAAGKIEDFGEKLHGARKDYAATLKDASALDVAAEPLSRSWPEPNYQKLIEGGADARAIAFVRSARDEVPTKPQKSWKLKGWVETVKALRNFSQSLIDGSLSFDAVQEKLNTEQFARLRDHVGGRAELYQAVGHDRSLKGVTLTHHYYSLYKWEKNVEKWAVEQPAKATTFGNWPRELAIADTKEAAIAEFKKKLDSLDLSKDPKKQTQFVIYRKGGQPGAFIGKKVGREYIDLKRVDDVKQARAYLESNTADLEKALEKYKETPLERRPDNQPRVGDDHRNGAAVTPENFSDTFGFRGVQFGNYVEQGRRQSDLNQAYDSLMDLAAVLGVAPNALSLNGKLGLAFGARGKGGKNAAAAHFEPDNIVINLTKGGGPGSLAHEWWHAADNYFARQSKDSSTGFASAGENAGLRDPLRNAFAAVKAAVGTKDMQARFAELDNRRSKPYWNTPHERSARAFEAYIISKLNDQNASNDYLANIVDEESWKVTESMRSEFFGEEAKPSYPYPTADEMPGVRTAFDEFFKTVEQREGEGGSKILAGSGVAGLVDNPDTGTHTLTAKDVEGIKNGADAIKWIVQNGHDPLQRSMAQRLAANVGENVEVQFVKAGDTAPANVARRLSGGATAVAELRPDGSYKMWFRIGPGMNETMLLHEIIHAATMKAFIGTKNAILRADMQNVLRTIRQSFTDVEYTSSLELSQREEAAFFARVLDDENELLAYSLSSPALRRWMNNMNEQGKFVPFEKSETYLRDKAEANTDFVPELTLWQRFVDSVRSLLGLGKVYAPMMEKMLADRAANIETFVRENQDSSLYTRLDDFFQRALVAQAQNQGATIDQLRAMTGEKNLQQDASLTQDGKESVFAGLRGFNQQEARNLFMDATTSHSNTAWFNGIRTQYAKAQNNPTTFGRVFDAVQDYIKDISVFANAAADLAPNILPKLDSWQDLKKGGFLRHGAEANDLKAAGAALWQGTLTDKKVYTKAELRALGLTGAQADLYKEARATINQSLEDLARTEIVRLAGVNAAPVLHQVMEAKTLAEASSILTDHLNGVADATSSEGPRETANLITEKVAQVEKLKTEGYAPLMRFGQHTLHIENGGKTLFFGMYESSREANRAERELRQDPEFAGAEFTQGKMSQRAFELYGGMPLDALELFAQTTGRADNPVYQDFLRLTKNNRSALKRLIKRQGIAGFSEDTSRVLASFVTSNSRMASGNMNLGRAKEAAEAIPKEMGDLKDDAIAMMQYVQNPQDEAQAVRGLLFTNFIGGSVASAAVNLTQPFTMTLPYLSQFGGLAKAAGHLLSAAKAAAGGTTTPEVQAALHRAEADGIVSPQEIHHLQAESMNRLGNHPVLKKAAFIWGSMFSLSEQFNRRVTFIAAYNTAKEHGMADPFKFAENSVIETQGLYNKGNKPNWARGPIGATVFTFKQFSIHYLEFLTRMYRSGPEGKKAVGVALAILMLTAGAGGLPFADDLDDLIDTLAQAMGYDFNSKRAKRKFISETLGLGDTAADVATRGLSSLPGMPIDVSLRMGMGNLIPGTGALLRSNTDRSKDVLEFAGAAGGLAKSMLDAGSMALKGEFAQAGMNLAPLAIQNIAKAMTMWNTGEYRNQKDQKVMDVDAVDAAMKFIGFQPAAVARESSRMSEVQQSVQLAKNVEGEIAGKWAQGLADRDQDKVNEAKQMLRDWNADNAETPMRLTMGQILSRVKEMGLTRAQRTLKSTPRELRPMVREELQ